MKKLVTTMTILSILLSSCAEKSRESGPVQIKIQAGLIEGMYNADNGLETYLGIPYAKPPVGELRWKAPQPVDPWDGVLETKKFGNTPVQPYMWDDMIFRSEKQGEDCLYLNVWKPAEKENKELLPVLVYFYGGGFVAGSGSEPRYDGATIAQKGIVALTVNYRLNIFGFFAHPELSAEAPYKASGNYGLLDQHAALQWVHDNIKAFGGDPERVTIAGESAGSISVSSQMSSPLSRKLIAGAIGESGAAVSPTLAPVPLAEAEQAGVEYMKALGYESISELRDLSAEELLDLYSKNGRLSFSTVIDGYFFPKSLPEIFTAGEQAQVPLLVGWNSAEIPGYAFTLGPDYTEEVFVQKVKEAFPENYKEVLEFYPHSNTAEIERSATDLASDRFIVYSTWKWFDLHRKNSDQAVFRYLYSKLRPAAKGTQNQAPPAIGAPHACEIEYAMGNLDLIDAWEWTDDDYKVSALMNQYFANFIKTGNPNGDGLPEWTKAEADDETPPVMVIDTESKTVEAENDARFRLLDKFYGKD